MIKIKPAERERIMEARCDICGHDIPNRGSCFEDMLEDHMIIGGYQDGKTLEAIVCIKCMEEKLSFIKIQRRDNTIGFC